MQPSTGNACPIPANPDLFEGGRWPSAEYDRQIARLRKHLGTVVYPEVYLVEVRCNDLSLAVNVGNQPERLLAVSDFPAADSARRLYPHMLVLDDGRGLNLGLNLDWIARISRERPFAPAPAQILYQERRLLQQLLYHARQLSEGTVALTSRRNLAALPGQATQSLSHELF